MDTIIREKLKEYLLRNKGIVSWNAIERKAKVRHSTIYYLLKDVPGRFVNDAQVFRIMQVVQKLNFYFEPEAKPKEEVESLAPREVSIDEIQKEMCRYYNIPLEIMHSKTRKREVVKVRHLSMFFSKEMIKASYGCIGLQIGDKDHATVMHACDTVNNLIDTDKKFAKQVEFHRERFKKIFI